MCHASYTVTNYLFYLLCSGAPQQIQSHFCLISTKMPRKIFVAPWGCRCIPWRRLCFSDAGGSGCMRVMLSVSMVTIQRCHAALAVHDQCPCMVLNSGRLGVNTSKIFLSLRCESAPTNPARRTVSYSRTPGFRLDTNPTIIMESCPSLSLSVISIGGPGISPLENCEIEEHVWLNYKVQS